METVIKTLAIRDKMTQHMRYFPAKSAVVISPYFIPLIILVVPPKDATIDILVALSSNNNLNRHSIYVLVHL